VTFVTVIEEVRFRPGEARFLEGAVVTTDADRLARIDAPTDVPRRLLASRLCLLHSPAESLLVGPLLTLRWVDGMIDPSLSRPGLMANSLDLPSELLPETNLPSASWPSPHLADLRLGAPQLFVRLLQGLGATESDAIPET
jgi:hypothetical protein